MCILHNQIASDLCRLSIYGESIMKIYYCTFGCKVNQYETENLRQRLTEKGYETAENMESADIFIINTCTVTAASDKKMRQALGRMKKASPSAVTVLTGCFAQAFEQQAKQLGCDIVTGTAKSEIPALLEDFLSQRKQIVSVRAHKRGEAFEPMLNLPSGTKTRAFVKIQDGCDQYCTYCVIPYARGHIRSKPLEDIRSEVTALARGGYKEIVLTGINLCCYGKDFAEDIRLVDAVETACAVQGIQRVRLSSMEPEMLLDEDIQRLARLEKLCAQFHLSLQSGCDKTLKRMNRKYTCEQYAELCTKLRQAFKDCTITTDIMVGFAGETDEDFAQTVEFVKRIAFEKVHIFPYSVRKGTAAESFSGQVPKAVKEQRAHQLEQVCARIRADFLRSNIGKTAEVLFEKEKQDGFHRGYTKNYTPVAVKADGDDSWRWQTRQVRIISAADDLCLAEPI